MRASTTPTTIRRSARWVAPLVFALALAACGDDASPQLEAGAAAAPAAVSNVIGSADALERHALVSAATSDGVTSADAAERHALADGAASDVTPSADAAERHALSSTG